MEFEREASNPSLPSRIALDAPAPSLDAAVTACSAPENSVPLGPSKYPVMLGHPALSLIGNAHYY